MYPPSAVVTVIVAVPADSTLTTPLLTVATLLSLVDQVTERSVAFEGLTVAVRVTVSPTAAEAVFLSKETDVTLIVGSPTVMVQVAVLPLLEVAVMTAVPKDTPVTVPFFTAATLESLVDHSRVLIPALDGLKFTSSSYSSPMPMAFAFSSKDMLETATLCLMQ